MERFLMKDSGIDWIGKIPENWRMIPNKYIFNYDGEKVGTNFDQYSLLSLTTSGIKEKNINDTGGKVPTSYEGYQTVKSGQMVFCLFDLDVSAVFSGISKLDGMITSAYDVFTCSGLVNSEYIDYFFQYVFSHRYYKMYSKNIRYTVTNEAFLSVKTPVPPLEEQNKIATFLDSKTSEIKSLIDNLNKQIESLKEYKKSLIYKCVTKGLDNSVPLKDSGIEWIGQIPENWKIERLQWHLREIKENNNPIKTDKVLSLTNKDGVIPYEEKGAQGNISKEDYSQYKLAYPDTIVANSMNILIGSVGICNCFGCVSPVYYVYKANNQSNLKFINYLFQTIPFQKELRKYANGILEIRLRVSSDDILKRQVCFPSLEEQNQIVDFLDNKCGKIDELICMQEAEIDNLTEYQKSLIYEYVTGKKEVV